MDGRSGASGLNLIERAREYDHRESLPPEEYEALMSLGADLANSSIYDAQCFILGSYHPDKKPRLEQLRQTICDWPGGNYRAYLMEDFPDGLHPIVEFQLLADYSDHVIGVIEHDKGGFQLELGMIVLAHEFRDRFSLLKRTYPTEDEEHEKYNWMLDAGAFDLFEYYGDLWEWDETGEFDTRVDELLTDLLD